MSDTIAAVATPPGRGGVGIVRVSGSKVPDICKSLVRTVPPARMAKFTPFLNADGSQIDAGLSLYFAAPNSFTGEDVLELHAHGGPVILDMLLRRVLELGARIARAGEFSERAFLNNKMDLLQVEAVAELINASSEQAAMAAMRSLQGDFSRKIHDLVEGLIRLRLYVEAAIDFPEEEINFLADAHVQNSLTELLNKVKNIYQQAKQGILVSEGVNAVIIGAPNVGKSTLINALTGQDTAIVTPIAGTTRDTIKATITIDGVLLNIIDTAGIRATEDIVEKEGIKRARRALELADLVLLVTDNLCTPLGPAAAARRHHSYSQAACELGAPPPRHPKASDFLSAELQLHIKPNAKIVIICNKIDQLNISPYIENYSDHSVVAISAHTGLGLDLLRAHIKEVVGAQHNPEGGLFLARRRHLDALLRAQQQILRGQQQLTQNAAGELLAEELKQAQQTLGEITGEFTSDELLGRIFSEFCIGK